MHFSVALVALVGSATSTVIFDGRFNDQTANNIKTWAWGNQVGPWQYYIHGSEDSTKYIDLNTVYRNPAESGSTLGARFTLDSTSYWNGQEMRRTELIPAPPKSTSLSSGFLYWHFSMKKNATNPPSLAREHQICFFESHFTTLKSGGSGVSDLRWEVEGQKKWNTDWVDDVWNNFAYGIDYTKSTVVLYHSTGSNPLTLVGSTGSTSSPGYTTSSSLSADFHLGVLELKSNNGAANTNEDFYFSGVYIETGGVNSLTTAIGSSTNVTH